jgi:Mrp family chromosome partitioning ATPase
MRELLDYLKRHFRRVLVDSPPLASVTDGLLLAQHADISLMVVRHNAVDRKLVRRSVASLRKVTEGLAGAVLNAVDFHSQGYHYYYYQQASERNDAKGQRERKPSRPVAV